MTAARNWTWTGVQAENLLAAWPHALRMLEPCLELDGGRYDAQALHNAIQRGDMQLWFAGPVDGAFSPSLAITTEIRVYPCQKWLNIKYVGGQGLPFAFDFLGTIEDWARAQGCVGCEGYGRPEWSRVLQSRGYQERGRSYDKRFQE